MRFETVDLALAAAAISFAFFGAIYGLYTVVVLKNRKIRVYLELVERALCKSLDYKSLPHVTILVPTFNEEAHISRKLENIAQLRYPAEKIEVLLIDDCSTDSTCEIAKNKFKELRLCGKIIRNSNRMGVNASYNTGATNANNDFILRTDADTAIEPDALKKAVQIFKDFDNAGGVTGTMMPITTNITSATIVESSYRNLFDRMAIAESALHSTFLGGGGFALLKKSIFVPIPVSHGSTDGNIALSIIKRGFRYLYIPQTFSQETIVHKPEEHVKQKIRRASRLIQSTLMNKDILFGRKSGQFGVLIFPLRFAMLTVCPVLMFTGFLATLLLFSWHSVFLALLLVFSFLVFLCLETRIRLEPLNSVTSLLFHQFYLLLGLFFVGKKMNVWKSPRGESALSKEQGPCASEFP